jgi:sortase A
MPGLASWLRRGTRFVSHDETTENGGTLAPGQGADLAAFHGRRAAAAVAYCSRVCAPDAIADAVEAAFARAFEAVQAGEAPDLDALDQRLRSAVRNEAAARASSATAGVPARRLLERLADPSRGGTCELVPALLAARADGALTDGDRERMAAHLRRCGDCRKAEQRFNEAERAFDALAGKGAPELGRSAIDEMLSEAPMNARQRFARERLAADPPDWLEEIDWEPDEAPVIQVPADALEPAITNVPTEDFPLVEKPRLGARARKRIAIAMLVLGLLLIGEAGATVVWKEPFTAFIAARAQDELTKQLHKLDAQQLSAADQDRLASIRDSGRRTDARIAALASREGQLVMPGNALGTLSITKLDLDYVVVQGTGAASLRKGPGHYLDDGGKLPGQGGLVGIAGHRTSYEAPFRNIDDLHHGDRITLKMPYGLFTYSVDRHRIVPSGFKGAFVGYRGEGLLLSACHPLYSASERILVYAHLVSRRPLGSALETQPPKPTGTPARLLAKARAAKRLKALGTRNLGPGMKGDDVKEVQRLLGLPAIGTFGPATGAAVTQFQQAHGLPPVGRVGSQTKAALARRPRPPSRPPTPPAVPQQPQTTP